MNRYTWGHVKSRPVFHAVWFGILALWVVKIVARWAWGYRAPFWMDMVIPLAIIAMVFVDARARRDAPTE